MHVLLAGIWLQMQHYYAKLNQLMAYKALGLHRQLQTEELTSQQPHQTMQSSLQGNQDLEMASASLGRHSCQGFREQLLICSLCCTSESKSQHQHAAVT